MKLPWREVVDTSKRARTSGVPRLLLLVAIILAICLLPHSTESQEPAGDPENATELNTPYVSPPATSNVPLDALLASRTGGCAVCERMARDVLPGQFVHDAHKIDCAKCHHPHVQYTAEEWKDKCSSPECHPQAWTRTVFHRVDPDVFIDCTNCHKPHVWTANGEDCLSCHEDIHGPEGNVAASAVQGAETWRNVPRTTEEPRTTLFSHESHDDLECSLCHRSETQHAEFVQTDATMCMDCHHGPEAKVSCSACHAQGEVPKRISYQATLQLSVWKAPRTRTLGFEHSIHSSLSCEQCHQQPGSKSVVACGTCHQQHHHPEAKCVTCHAAPPEDVHPMSVHTTRSCAGSGCHTRVVSSIPDERNYCLACHQDMTDHNEDRNCTSCHVLPKRDLFAP